MKRTLLLTALGALIVLAAAACSDERDSRVEAVLADTTTSSPLAELFGVSSNAVSNPGAAEAVVADCMARAGFVYEAIDDRPGGGSFTAAATPSFDEVSEHGYGIADDLDRGIREFGGEVFVDPNDAIREGLSADELAQYEQALTGISADEIVFSDEGTPLDAATGEIASPAQFEQASSDGCAYQAYAPQINDGATRLLASDIYAEAQTLIQTDGEMIGLIDGWRRCMSDAGHPYREQADIFDDLVDEGDNVYHEATEDHHDVTQAEIDAMLDALRDREITIAQADWDCSQPLFDATPEITRRIEAGFIIANEDRLVDLLNADA